MSWIKRVTFVELGVFPDKLASCIGGFLDKEIESVAPKEVRLLSILKHGSAFCAVRFYEDKKCSKAKALWFESADLKLEPHKDEECG
ncbi:hypothetical protein TcasGA2_TC000343 [Tribolium castaneum]|uniref:Uncharacterized protein n=1 Tax=Tribolium castaneum TaxID=7070 RepID=D6WAT8_TRICA|nr:hypothetical protein TcasGA2_TC000343 [Tribolium castaneum]